MKRRGGIKFWLKVINNEKNFPTDHNWRCYERCANGRVNEDKEECSFFRIEIIDPRLTIKNCPGNNILSFLMERAREKERELHRMGQLDPDLERVNLPATQANYFPVFSPYPGSSIHPCGNQTTKPCIWGWNLARFLPVKNLSLSLQNLRPPRLFILRFATRIIRRLQQANIWTNYLIGKRYDRLMLDFTKTNWQSCLSLLPNRVLVGSWSLALSGEMNNSFHSARLRARGYRRGWPCNRRASRNTPLIASSPRDGFSSVRKQRCARRGS